MKYFASTVRNEQYSYNSPTYLRGFGTSLYLVEEIDYCQLETKAKQALSSDDTRTALIYAGKAAIEYGIAGLVLYTDIYTKALSKLSTEGELIEQEAMTLLAYVFFARQMLLEYKDTKALKSMEYIHCDDDYQSDVYWKEKEEKLLSLLDNNHFAVSEAQLLARWLIDKCR